jgi:hypothetical protein
MQLFLFFRGKRQMMMLFTVKKGLPPLTGCQKAEADGGSQRPAPNARFGIEPCRVCCQRPPRRKLRRIRETDAP